MTVNLKRIWARCWLVALILAVWQLLSSYQVLDPLFFPRPSKLAGTLTSLIASGELERQLGYTLARAGAGYVAGVLLGTLVSVLLCAWGWLRPATWPVISALYSTPRLTLLPMAMLIFGVNEISRVFLVALSTFLIVVIQLADAVRMVSRDYVSLAMNYGASRATVIRRVYLPACLPQAFTALRLSFGRALVLTISVELLSCNNGLGSMIWSAWQTFATERLYATVLVAAAMGMLSHAVFAKIERLLVPWENRRT
jgi:ABC-type nitrate/sulfonate/bicarbonate transport system permease component